MSCFLCRALYLMRKTMKVVLVNPYELGRQPFGLAEPAALLEQAGCDVRCCDLSIQKLDDCLDSDTQLVAVYVAMHTATRIAAEALPKIRRLALASQKWSGGFPRKGTCSPSIQTLGVIQSPERAMLWATPA